MKMFSLICVLVYIAVTAKNFHCASVHSQGGFNSQYRPSISELTVPLRDNPKIILSNFPGNSVTLPLLNGMTSASNYFVHLARQAGNSDPGYFIVEAPKGQGVMAVIQQLHLRRISDNHSLLQLVNNCKDYLMFEGFNGEKTSLICGSMDKGDESFYPKNLNGPKFFNSPDGRIKVTFRNHYTYYGNELVATHNDTQVKQNHEIIKVEITFTAYTKCQTPSETRGKFQCTLEKCIDKELVCDDVVNCSPGENQRHSGIDETNCTTPQLNRMGIHNQRHHQNGNFKRDNEITDDTTPDPADQDESKPPRMTTILFLVGALILITICGYFWSWLTQLCCVARRLFKSAEVGVGVQQQQPPPQPVPVFEATTSRPTAYYVPTLILRPVPSRNGHNTSTSAINSQNNTSMTSDSHACLKQSDDSESPPPSYDLLFGHNPK